VALAMEDKAKISLNPSVLIKEKLKNISLTGSGLQTLLCTDFGNNGRRLLVLKFWSANGMCDIHKGTDKGVSP
jgi:hypothetical protein